MIAAGFGFRTGAGLSSLRAALTLAQRGQPPVALLAAPQDKLAALTPLAEEMSLPLIGLPPEVLASTQTLSRSAASMAARGTGSVAEAAALAAAGTDARLLTLRHISPDRMATCAIAQGTPS